MSTPKCSSSDAVNQTKIRSESHNTFAIAGYADSRNPGRCQTTTGSGAYQSFGVQPRLPRGGGCCRRRGSEEGLLKFGLTFLNPYAGYLCIISGPDGHIWWSFLTVRLGRPSLQSKSATSAP